MKETTCVLDALMFIFQYHMNASVDIEACNRPQITDHLTDVGFDHATIDSAFDWLRCLQQCRDSLANMPLASKHAFRIYAEHERFLFDQECRDFIQLLMSLNILDHHSREIVLDLAMALEDEQIDVSLLKWVTLMTLYNNEHSKEQLSRMELFSLKQPDMLVH